MNDLSGVPSLLYADHAIANRRGDAVYCLKYLEALHGSYAIAAWANRWYVF